MGLADKLADIIRPRPAGLFSGLAPATTSGPSAASILSGAASEIAREGVRAFIRALETMRDPEVASHLDIPADDTSPAPTPTQSPVKITWGGVPLRGFADDEYFSIEIDKLNQQTASFHDALLKRAGFGSARRSDKCFTSNCQPSSHEASVR